MEGSGSSYAAMPCDSGLPHEGASRCDGVSKRSIVKHWLSGAASGVALSVSAFVALSGVVSRPGRVPTSLEAAAPFKDAAGGPGAPLAKQVVVGMDTNINQHVAWDDWEAWSREMEPYWTLDMVYDFAYVGEWNFNATTGLRAWFDGEHMHYNRALPDCQFTDFIRAATNTTCTSASYGLARWEAPLAGVPPPPGKPWVRIRDLDFYLIEGNRIKVNWCLIDVIALFIDVGYDVLPPAPMPTDGYLPPFAMDGYPAPMSANVNSGDSALSERIWRSAINEDFLLGSTSAQSWANNMVWYGPGGIGTAHSKNDYQEHFLAPLSSAFSNRELQLDMVVCEGKYCGAHFYLYGNHTGRWLGEAATGKRVPIRCGAHARIEGGKIREGWLIIDIPRTFRAMGIDLFARARATAVLF